MRCPQVKKRETIRHGRAFDLTVENVTLPNGVNIDMDIIRHPGASAIIALSTEEEVVMLKQYRHAIGGELWEIPAGTFDGKEDPLVCAQRELIEETGYEAQTWESIGAVTPVPGYSDERIYLFIARDLIRKSQKLDPDEIIEVHRLPFRQVVSMILGGEIEDAKTVSAIFHTLPRLKTAINVDGINS
jgi:ADP-ribose pyrophosphatase